MFITIQNQRICLNIIKQSWCPACSLREGFPKKLYNQTSVPKSKHLKGQLDPPVGNEKCVFVTKNDHFGFRLLFYGFSWFQVGFSWFQVQSKFDSPVY